MLRTTTPIAATAIIFAASGAWAGGHGSTEDVLNHHLTSFGAGDLEGVMSDYTEDSVIILPGAKLEGLEAIEGLFVALIGEFSKPGMVFNMGDVAIHNNVAYITWTAETADNVYGLSTDTFVIEDGKIAVQTVTVAATPK